MSKYLKNRVRQHAGNFFVAVLVIQLLAACAGSMNMVMEDDIYYHPDKTSRVSKNVTQDRKNSEKKTDGVTGKIAVEEPTPKSKFSGIVEDADAFEKIRESHYSNTEGYASESEGYWIGGFKGNEHDISEIQRIVNMYPNGFAFFSNNAYEIAMNLSFDSDWNVFVYDNRYWWFPTPFNIKYYSALLMGDYPRHIWTIAWDSPSFNSFSFDMHFGSSWGLAWNYGSSWSFGFGWGYRDLFWNPFYHPFHRPYYSHYYHNYHYPHWGHYYDPWHPHYPTYPNWGRPYPTKPSYTSRPIYRPATGNTIIGTRPSSTRPSSGTITRPSNRPSSERPSSVRPSTTRPSGSVTRPTIRPTMTPTTRPTTRPTVRPNTRPTTNPTMAPTVRPSTRPRPSSNYRPSNNNYNRPSSGSSYSRPSGGSSYSRPSGGGVNRSSGGGTRSRGVRR